eukprot:112952_1
MAASTHSSFNTNDACIIYEHNRTGTMVIKHDLESLFYCDIMDDDLHANSDCNFTDENESDFVVNEELLYNRSTISSDYGMSHKRKIAIQTHMYIYIYTSYIYTSDTSITIPYVESYDESFMDIFYEFDDEDHDSVSGHSYLFCSESSSLSNNQYDNEYKTNSVNGHSFYKNDNEYDNEYETDSVSGHSFYKNDNGSLSLQASITDNKCVDVVCIIDLE